MEKKKSVVALCSKFLWNFLHKSYLLLHLTLAEQLACKFLCLIHKTLRYFKVDIVIAELQGSKMLLHVQLLHKENNFS